MEGKAERDLHRLAVPTGIPQPEMLVLWGWWRLDIEVQASEVRHWEEDWDCLCEGSLRGLGCGAPHLRESGKISFPEGEGWICHKSFFLHVLSGGRAPST